MGRCRYGEAIKSRISRQAEILVEERKRPIHLTKKRKRKRPIVLEPSSSDSEPDSTATVVVDEVEGEDEVGDDDERNEDEGSGDGEDEDEGSGDGEDDDEGSEDGEDDEEEQVARDSHWWIPQHLTPLKGSAATPKVDDHRVDCAKGTDRYETSEMTMADLLSVAERFPWPLGVELKLPCAGGGYLAKYPGCVVVHEEVLKIGFRLPLHPFIRDLLSFKKLCPAQLSPNSWRFILAFLVKFKELNLVPSYEAFMEFHDIRRRSGLLYSVSPRRDMLPKNLISTPGVPRSWEKRWFLVCHTEAYHFNFPMYVGDQRWCYGDGPYSYTNRMDNKPIDLVKEVRKSLPGFRTCYRNLYHHQLEKAGLTLSRSSRGPYWKERSVNKRKQEVACCTSLLKKREPLSKRVKKCHSLQSVSSSSVERESGGIAPDEESEEEEEQEEEHSEEEEDNQEEEKEEKQKDGDLEEEEEEQEKEDSGEEGNGWIPQEDVEVKVDVDVVEPSLATPHEKPNESSLVRETLVHGEKEVRQESGIDVAPPEGGEFPSIPPVSGGTSSTGTSCLPQIPTTLRRLLPDIVLAAQHLEAVEQQLNESRKENLELRREKAELERQLVEKDREFQSRMERMEQEKKAVEDELIASQSKLLQTARKAKELFDMSHHQ